jgi:hypothetical protein
MSPFLFCYSANMRNAEPKDVTVDRFSVCRSLIIVDAYTTLPAKAAKARRASRDGTTPMIP